MARCLVRLVEHWESIKVYFLQTLTAPPVSQNNKKAMETDCNKDIVNMIKPSKEKANLVRIKFLIFLAKICEPFLLSLQSEMPMIHKLFTRSVELAMFLMNLVVKNEKIPEDGRKLASLAMNDDLILLKPKDCNFGEAVNKELKNIGDAEALRKELKSAVIAEIKYLLSHLPLKNNMLARLKYLNPKCRKDEKMPSELTLTAASLKRFDADELSSLSAQLNVYQVLRDEEVLSFNEKIDRLDHYWRAVF